jgi:hypothetical protein
MHFTALAIFTTITPPEHVLRLLYVCSIEKDIANDAFTLRVLDPRRNHKEVSSAILNCPPSAVTEAARARIQQLHPEREFTLAPFEPWAEWQRVLRTGQSETTERQPTG